MKKVMVIDDDEGILEGFRAMLEVAGYAVETYTNADVLLQLLQVSPKTGTRLPSSQEDPVLPDLILLDVLLSGADGREVCRLLKSKKKTKDIPVIMVSAHPGVGEAFRGCLADDFLAKPFEMDELLAKVANLIRKNHGV